MTATIRPGPHRWLDELYLRDVPPDTRPELDVWLDRAFRAAERCKAEDPSAWWATIDEARRHPLLERLHEDPYQRRAFLKPRGYAGDAVMLDLIYDGLDALPADERASLTRFGAELFRAYQDRPSCESIRERRLELGRQITAAAARRPGARILAVACGHLREADLVEASAWAGVSEVVAFDQDRHSLAFVASRYPDLPIRAERGRIQDLVLGGGPEGPFDLVYAAGLHDYLDDATASALNASLAARLSPGGRLLVGNMDKRSEMDFADVVQAWTLVTRTPAQMAALADDLRARSPDLTTRVWADRWGSVLWLEAARA